MIDVRMKSSGWILVCYSIKQRNHLYRMETDNETDLHRGLNECLMRKADIIFVRRYEK